MEHRTGHRSAGVGRLHPAQVIEWDHCIVNGRCYPVYRQSSGKSSGPVGRAGQLPETKTQESKDVQP